MKKKLLKFGFLAAAVGGAYALWQKAEHERAEREIWAEVAASFDEFPEEGEGKSSVRYK